MATYSTDMVSGNDLKTAIPLLKYALLTRYPENEGIEHLNIDFVSAHNSMVMGAMVAFPRHSPPHLRVKLSAGTRREHFEEDCRLLEPFGSIKGDYAAPDHVYIDIARLDLKALAPPDFTQAQQEKLASEVLPAIIHEMEAISAYLKEPVAINDKPRVQKAYEAHRDAHLENSIGYISKQLRENPGQPTPSMLPRQDALILDQWAGSGSKNAMCYDFFNDSGQIDRFKDQFVALQTSLSGGGASYAGQQQAESVKVEPRLSNGVHFYGSLAGGLLDGSKEANESSVMEHFENLQRLIKANYSLLQLAEHHYFFDQLRQQARQR